MKRLLLLTVCAAMTSACVTKEYDLKDGVYTDNAGIGDADAQFVIPLANIRVDSNELTTGKGGIITMFDGIDVWIPASYNSIEVQKLNDSQYIGQWVEDLCSGMNDGMNDSKEESGIQDNDFDRVVEHIHKNRMEDFRYWVAASNDLDTYKNNFRRSWNYFRTGIERKIGQAVAEDVANVSTEVAPTDYTIDNSGLDNKVIDMLAEWHNDDALALCGSVVNRMKLFECKLKAELLGTSVGFDLQVQPADSTVDIPVVKIPAREARTIVQRSTMRLTLTPVRFYPRTPADPGEQLLVQLKLRRKGGMPVNL